MLLMGEMQMRWRKQVENAPLAQHPGLKTALTRSLPHWLEAIGRQGDLGEVRNRKDRMDALAEWLARERTPEDLELPPPPLAEEK